MPIFLIDKYIQQIQRGPRRIDTVRARRKRYRQKKKTQYKERWEQRLDRDVFKQWKERQMKAMEEETCMMQSSQHLDEDMTIQSLEDQSHSETSNQQEADSCQAQVYDEVAKDSMHSDIDALLLPSVVVPEEPQYTYQEDIPSQLGLTGVKRVAINHIIQVEKHKAKKAFETAHYYRNLAEDLKKEKRALACMMNDKVELVRNFWRNNIREGSTRAGKMVQIALKSKPADV